MLQTSWTSWIWKTSFYQSQDFLHQEYLIDFFQSKVSVHFREEFSDILNFLAHLVKKQNWNICFPLIIDDPWTLELGKATNPIPVLGNYPETSPSPTETETTNPLYIGSLLEIPSFPSFQLDMGYRWVFFKNWRLVFVYFVKKPWRFQMRKEVHTFWTSGDLEILKIHRFYLVYCSFHINVLRSNVSHTDFTGRWNWLLSFRDVWCMVWHMVIGNWWSVVGNWQSVIDTWWWYGTAWSVMVWYVLYKLIILACTSGLCKQACFCS